MVDDKINNDIEMQLRCHPFLRPCGCNRAIQMASPNAACPGQPRKPLYTAIRQLLALYCPSGHQGNSKWNNDKKNGPTLLVILMAAAVRRYNTACDAQWRRSRASLEATGCCHWVGISANSMKGTWLCQFFWCFSLSTRWKKLRVRLKAPVFNRGLTYATKENGLTKLSIYFVGGVILVE